MALDPDLVEWTYGAYERMTSAEIEVGVPGWMVLCDGFP
jgi:probable phosphoglycerate mutase